MLNFAKVIVSKKTILLIIGVLSICLLIVYSIVLNRNAKIDLYLANQTKLFDSQYKTMYDNFKTLANLVFYEVVNKDDIIDIFKESNTSDLKVQNEARNKLYKKLEKDYLTLKTFNFKQLHFHLPNNVSFLRMHQKDKYGDNLSDVRFSIKKVNSILKPIDGFEMGRIVQGYRFVYPMFDNTLHHIGSVETSISTSYFKAEFEKNFDVEVHFIILKSVVDKKIFQDYKKDYVESFENKDYYRYSPYDINANNYSNYLKEKDFTPSLLEKISQKMRTKASFAIDVKIDGTFKVINFVPIKNIEDESVVAYFITYQNSSYLDSLEDNFYEQLVVTFLIILLVFSLIYKIKKEEEKNRLKDEMLSQQSKLASMGGMIGNIAHQWRQPLSAISTAASGVKLHNELEILSDELLIESMDSIVKNTKYLSHTIDDFRNFFRDSKEIIEFNIKDLLEDIMNIFSSSLQNNNILYLQNCEDIYIRTYQNELKQAIINIIKNAKDAIEKDGIISCNISKDKRGYIIISIQDTGGGIDKNVLPYIFDPYFTTKHQSQGTGIGLYMTYQIIVEHLGGEIKVRNEELNYNFTSYQGALFEIAIKDLDF